MNPDRWRDIEALADALIASNLIPRYREYAVKAGSAEKVEVRALAVNWAEAVLDALPDGWRHDSIWHHSPDAPPEHFCADCDDQLNELGFALAALNDPEVLGEQAKRRIRAMLARETR